MPAVYVRRGCAGQGSTRHIIEVQWKCTGNEQRLVDCQRGNKMCDHRMDAGVYCSG